MSWPTATHESPDIDITIPDATASAYLWAMLKADGEYFRAADNYAEVREHLARAVEAFATRVTGGQQPSVDVTPQRLRTWRTAFEELGLLTVDEDERIRATRFGRAVVDGLDAVSNQIDAVNRHIASLGAEVANRVLLAKPDARGNPPSGVPTDSDLRPLRAIWRAFRALDNRLHWQDINRVLGHIHYERELPEAIERIRRFRELHSTTYPNAQSDLERLGTSALTDDARRITPWFNRAGLGGLLIPSELVDGFRTLQPSSLPIIDPLLDLPLPPIPAAARGSRNAYIEYLMEPVVRRSLPNLNAHDSELIARIVSTAQAFGGRKIITLAGLPGTGKSRAAKLAAEVLSEADPLRSRDIQFHESTTYEDFIEGFVPRADGQGFERRSKTFRIMNQRALDNPGRTYVLIIEEFTRANVPSVLGEVLTFIEHRGRAFTLALSQDEISIAPNLVIIATMNPRDRSALNLDDAVSRRLHRITLPPSSAALRSMLDGALAPELLNRLVEWFDAHVSSLPFGHGVFEGANSPTRLAQIWEGTIVPLLSDPLGQIPAPHRAAFDAYPFKQGQGA